MLKRAMLWLRRVAIGVGIAALAYVAIVVALNWGGTQPHVSLSPKRFASAAPARLPADRDCAGALADRGPAGANARSRTTLAIVPFGIAETGWQTYEALIARTIGTRCAADTGAFAGRLAAWQAAHGIAGSGTVDAATLNRLALAWLEQRPFIAAMRSGCPPSPDPAQLATASAGEAFGGKTILARAAALAAYRRMVAAARQDGIAAPYLQIASAWRGPDEELARCAQGGCGTAAKAHCSAHRTGLAFDLVLGDAAGNDGFSTAPANRLALSRTAAYRWLVAHADRFGFVNYPYEPWHWEWTGGSI